MSEQSLKILAARLEAQRNEAFNRLAHCEVALQARDEKIESLLNENDALKIENDELKKQEV